MKYFAFAALVTLVGCSTTVKYDSENDYKTHSGENYNIKGYIERNIDRGFFSTDVKNNLVLYVNDYLVIKGPLHTDGSGSIQGVYDSKVVKLDCKDPSILKDVECLVHIDRKRIGLMSFDYVL